MCIIYIYIILYYITSFIEAIMQFHYFIVYDDDYDNNDKMSVDDIGVDLIYSHNGWILSDKRWDYLLKITLKLNKFQHRF